MKKKLLFFLCIFVEIAIIGFFGFHISNKTNIKGISTSVNILKKEDLVFGNSKDLKYFYEIKPNAKGEDVNSWARLKAIYTTNADSLNERFDYLVEKPAGVFRIMTIGDSFTFGLYVDTKDNYPEQLEDLLNNTLACKNIKKFEVINLGITGYDIQYAIERYKLRGAKYQPDMILWFLKDDDFLEIKDLVTPEQIRYEKEYQRMTDEEKKNIKPPFTRAWEESISTLGRENIVNKQKEFFEDFFSIYKNKLVFLSFENLDSEFKKILNGYVAKRKNAFFHDSLTNIYTEADVYFFDRHPTNKGHALMAADIRRFLYKNDILPCM